jgi:hypothetical protein
VARTAAEGGRWSRAWPHLRAAFVVFHLVAVVLMALPAPVGGMNRSAWADPTVQAELQTWRQRLAPGMGQEEFEDRLYAAASELIAARKQVLRPFQPYYLGFGTEQNWRMFVAPQMVTSRLTVELQDEEGGAWRPIFVERSAEHRWRARQLGHERMRSAIFRYGWKQYDRSEGRLSAWLAARAAEDFPEAFALRTRWFRQRSASPAQVLAGTEPEGRYERARVHPLAPLRAAP